MAATEPDALLEAVAWWWSAAVATTGAASTASTIVATAVLTIRDLRFICVSPSDVNRLLRSPRDEGGPARGAGEGSRLAPSGRDR
jgi:hypothetical protein